MILKGNEEGWLRVFDFCASTLLFTFITYLRLLKYKIFIRQDYSLDPPQQYSPCYFRQCPPYSCCMVQKMRLLNFPQKSVILYTDGAANNTLARLRKGHLCLTKDIQINRASQRTRSQEDNTGQHLHKPTFTVPTHQNRSLGQN